MRFNPALFARAGRQLSIIFSLIIFLALTGATVAIAQTVNTAPLPAGATTDATTVLGWVLRALLAGTFIAGAWAAFKLSQFLSAKTNETGQSVARQTMWGAINTGWLKIQTIGSKVLIKEKPLMEKILADGKVTHEELTQFTNAIIADFREIAAAELPIIKDLLLGGSESGLTSMIHGWAATVANKLLSGGAGDKPTASPTSAAPAPVPVVAPASPQ